MAPQNPGPERSSPQLKIEASRSWGFELCKQGR